MKKKHKLLTAKVEPDRQTDRQRGGGSREREEPGFRAKAAQSNRDPRWTNRDMVSALHAGGLNPALDPEQEPRSRLITDQFVSYNNTRYSIRQINIDKT